MTPCFLKAAAPFLLAFAITTPLLAEPIEGSYSLEGANPSGSTYSGKVTVAKAGTGYEVEWDIAGNKFHGGGLLQGGTLSIGFFYANQPGVVLMQIQSDASLRGAWYYVGDNGSLGQESWTKP
ncbi:MAG: hypothetical protein ACHQF3_13110 [Alphaproteobacteria bacterium]